jgi:ABC-type spermidine/putrescine transport system permease subunit II
MSFLPRWVPRPRLIFTIIVMLLLYAPIVLVVIYSVNKDTALLSWKGFTWKWYSQAFHDPDVRSAFWTSVQVAVFSTALSLVVAITAGLWFRKASRRTRAWFDALTYSRIVLPEVVFALGLFILFQKLHIELGIMAIVLSHVVFTSAYATIIIQARFATMNESLEEAAADLGANRWRVFKRVTLPLLMPAVIVAGLLCLTFSFDDVIASQFLGGTNAQTLPVLVLGKIRLHVTPEVNAIGAGLMVITLVTFTMAGLITMLRPTGAGSMLGFGRKAAK